MLRKGRRRKPGTLSLYKPHTDSQAEVTALMPVAVSQEARSIHVSSCRRFEMKRIGNPCPPGFHVVLEKRDRSPSALPHSWCPGRLEAWLRCLNSGLPSSPSW